MSETKAKKGPSFFKERLYPIFFMIIITVVFITAVSGLYLSTEDLVKMNETLFQKKAVLYAADIPLPEDGNAVDDLYNTKVEELTSDSGTAFRILDDFGKTAGIVVFSVGPGLWGEIQAVVGYDAAGQKMTGVEFVKQNETPGLGARIAETWFKEQFRSKVPPFTMVPEGTASSTSEIDSITGATRTSTAVLTIMNNSAETAEKVLEEVK